MKIHGLPTTYWCSSYEIIVLNQATSGLKMPNLKLIGNLLLYCDWIEIVESIEACLHGLQWR